jgi:hypothetical protein
MANMLIKNVAILGADGKLGPSVLNALLASKFAVTVMKRQSSKTQSNYPSSVKEVRIPDDFHVKELTRILQGQDAVVITTSGSLIDMQKSVALAAAKAGVQRFIPADFGSVDSESELARSLVPLYVHKRNLRLYLTELTEQYPKFSWTAIVCGHFFDWSLEFMHIWARDQRVDIIDDGNTKASASSLGLIAKATARVLEYADKPETKNKILYVQSFCKTQMEVKDALDRVTEREWRVQRFESNAFLNEKKALMEKGGREGADATEDIVWWLGATDANWEKNDGFAMELLDLEEEDLDAVLKSALAAN